MENAFNEKYFRKAFSILQKNYVEIPLEKVGKKPFNNLVATFLSPRTRDEVTYSAFMRLYQKIKDFRTLSEIKEEELSKMIYPVAFYKIKARNLIKTAKLIIENHKGKVPETIEELTQLPGVGRKVANIVLGGSFNKDVISVDTHVHKITNMLGWVKTKTPEKTEIELMKIIPQKYWKKTNKFFVSIGRQYNSKRKLEEFLRKVGLLKG